MKKLISTLLTLALLLPCFAACGKDGDNSGTDIPEQVRDELPTSAASMRYAYSGKLTLEPIS